MTQYMLLRKEFVEQQRSGYWKYVSVARVDHDMFTKDELAQAFQAGDRVVKVLPVELLVIDDDR